MRVNANSAWIQRALIRALGIQGRFPLELDTAASPTGQLAALQGDRAGLVLDHVPVIATARAAPVLAAQSWVAVTPPAGKVLVVDSVLLSTPDGGAGNGPVIALESEQGWVTTLFPTATTTAQMVAMRGPLPQARSRIHTGSIAAAPTPTLASFLELFYPPTVGAQLLGEGFALYGSGAPTDGTRWQALVVQMTGVNLPLRVTVTGREYDLTQWLDQV